MKELAHLAKVDRLLCQKSLYYLCKEVLGYKDMVPHVHGDLCYFATHPSFGRYRQATVPRSWFKTWVLTIGKSIWLTLPDEAGEYKSIYPYRGPNARILIASYTIDLAAKMVNKIKGEWENNDRLKAAFPELIPDFNKTRWSDHCAEIKHTGNFTEGTYTAVGVGGSVISQHFDHIIEDDLIYAKKDDFTGMELMPNQEDIDNAIGWHKLSSSLFVNPKESCLDNVGTRWAPHDLIAYIREYEHQYTCFEITATKGGQWPIPDDSFCIWPERFDSIALEEIRQTQGAKLFETQYLNRPRAGEDITFETAYVKKHASIEEFPRGAKYFTIVDVASWKDKQRICNNVILTGCRDEQNHLWVARVDAGKFNPTEVIEYIKSHQKQFNSKVLVEEVGYQVALRHYANLDMQKEGNEVYTIEALPPDNRKGAKDLRIEALQPVVKNGMFHCLAGMTKFLQEMEDYPYASTKDSLDCAGFLHRYARAAGKPKPKVVENPFSIEVIERELKNRSRSNLKLPFDVQLGGKRVL